LKRKNITAVRKQSGFVLLLGLLFALGIILTLMPVFIRYYDQQDLYRQERETGQELAKISVGLQGYISAIQNGTITMPATQTGLTFLKPPSCGGPATNPAEGYIPCTVGNYGNFDSLFGGQFQTTFTTNATTHYFDARMTFIPLYQEKNKLGQIAANIIDAARSTPAGSPTGTFATYLSNVPSTATAASPQIMTPGNPDFGRVTLVVSNAPSNDIYLRVDGTNQMLAALNMDGHNLVNANNIQATGNVTAGGDGLFGGGVAAQGVITSGSDITAQNNISAGNNLNSSKDVLAGRNIVAGKDVVAEGVTNNDGTNPSLTRGIYSATMITGPSTIKKPNCESGQTPQIFAAVQSAYTQGGDAIDGIDLQATNASATTWAINPVLHVLHLSMTAPTTWSPGQLVKSWTTEQPTNAKIVVFTKCN
jgi:hypothetical protein